ncbi:cupin domain-containing protein [Phenylobacterium sp.]|uniref:cupin domain-containing protein n=1 Tax=Phenylobacterium sp. TaxID=1871053 RepID=UPI00286E3EB6|nr:cupin domain-containing protein [Phenylobacterium sp.]
MTAESAANLIARLNLAPHPEGGWYRETWRAPAAPGARSPGTAILFLLEAGQASHWHRIDATELWLFQAGTALTLKTAAHDTGPIAAVRLGPLAGDAPQAVVAAGEWQAAQASPDGWALVACVVVPGFDFAGFELAAKDWAPG